MKPEPLARSSLGLEKNHAWLLRGQSRCVIHFTARFHLNSALKHAVAIASRLRNLAGIVYYLGS